MPFDFLLNGLYYTPSDYRNAATTCNPHCKISDFRRAHRNLALIHINKNTTTRPSATCCASSSWAAATVRATHARVYYLNTEHYQSALSAYQLAHVPAQQFGPAPRRTTAC